MGWSHRAETERARLFLDPPDFSPASFCEMLACMGNKDKGKKETKKAPKPKPKPEPGRKREIFTSPAPPK
jgi:hypothetical protein